MIRVALEKVTCPYAELIDVVGPTDRASETS
jgi:hypothetical protein